MTRTAALCLSAVLIFGDASFLLAQPQPPQARSRIPSRKKSKKRKAAPCITAECKLSTSAPEITSPTPGDATAQTQLGSLARGLHTATPGAYDKLSVFATKNAANVWGARAALAVGYEDYTKNRLPQALNWFAKARNDTLLREYVLFWTAQAKRSKKNLAGAYADLQTFQQDYPSSAMREQFLEAYAPTALDTGHAREAIEALNAYAPTNTRPALLLERAQAYKVARQLAKAAKDYQTLYYKYPLSDEAKAAATSLPQIARELGSEYSPPTLEMQLQRAQIIFDAHKWKDARSEFEKVAPLLRDPGLPKRQLAQLRIAQTKLHPKGPSTILASLTTPDPEVDAERLFGLSQAYRSEKKESEMFATLDSIGQKYPHSVWNEEALMASGNYYWVLLDRARAIGYYQRLVDAFPDGKNAYNAEWRVAWITFLNKQPDADQRLTTFLAKYPVSANAVDALYWLGRSAERSGNPGHARTYYAKAIERFPQTYFAHAAATRLEKLGPGTADQIEVLAKIPDPPTLRPFDEPVPAAAADRWARAQALRIIAFDASAELELKNAYFSTSSPRFLLEAAQAAFDQGHFAAGMAYGRIIVPSFESRKISDVPMAVWKTLYPLPYETALRREAARNDFDPMFAAGLIRQESTFQADIVSYANAIGLMQVLPKTGKILAKQLKVRYNKKLLYDANYNLQLGMLYIANLVRLTGAPEYAAAAYNAGEDRIALWKSERNYEEIPELVESIPFTQTREYVQIVLRNAAVYRMIYGAGGSQAVLPVSAASSHAKILERAESGKLN
ncbi:MAG: transglycosylase SLT domain-containing protein [Acidobacteriota bacterium]|nr:transglycosylase SLT domain-containing protein [Acidobacteriota bacterium]